MNIDELSSKYLYEILIFFFVFAVVALAIMV